MTELILKYKKSIVITFIVLAMVSVVVQFGVKTNYDMVDYLSDDAPSIKSTDVMDKEFNDDVPNTRVMIKDVSIQEALAYKQKLEAIAGVSGVMWLDDVMDVTTPIEMENKDTVETYYKDGNALFSFEIESGKEVETTDAVYDLIGKDNAMSGEALNTANSQQSTTSETMNAALILVPVVILILLLSTTSWLEPVFFLITIGVSVLINMGTNIFLGEVSFVTQAVAPILQLAVSLDYAIFLLHSFTDYRETEETPAEAMKLAMKRSFPAIAASASTTVFGFTALMFMDFGLGADLGLNLLKGIILSFISVMVFLPALTLMLYKWIDRTKHRAFLPSKYNFGKYIVKLRIPVLLIVAILIVPAFLAQGNTDFLYGTGGNPDDTRAGQDEQAIEDVFDKYTPMVLLVPKGDLAREELLVQDLDDLDEVKSTISYVNTVGSGIPSAYLDESITKSFFSEHYSRITLNTTTDSEGDEAFALVEKVKQIAADYYSDDYHALGESVTMYDMKDIVEKDNTLVNALTVISIALVLLITFRSISFPVVLLLTIETSVWINLAVPYLTDSPLVYIGYLIISTVQLAATVDYGILFTENYTQLRKDMSALDAVKKTIDEKTFSIGVSASILSSVGFILSATSSDPIVSSIGLLLGRGALLAFIAVLLLLPALLIVLDRLLAKTTWKSNFYKRNEE
ncbi:putative RND superfamily exporter protein [Lederbergia galactosidilyticus]|uniref:efflux RND transporter permease subunit n=1 Tax=Lederbergia galactosidilytica TaxID=217031 RepID=UPI001AEB344A|nr:MMPL family transporter [Lederbergia galactosidilytica]MBP1915169.1 putative RND superfamily exporter protein [Lederbergia galactosidilytica]